MSRRETTYDRGSTSIEFLIVVTDFDSQVGKLTSSELGDLKVRLTGLKVVVDVPCSNLARGDWESKHAGRAVGESNSEGDEAGGELHDDIKIVCNTGGLPSRNGQRARWV
ncbi:hypothetical protein NLJ89_g10886 [Agrocybe chaxingu]|uniref:Uncharacterized protein n=1 Tax=Agrocybe chaxingu TaxID=84603 RepID=A0A9W8MQH2_9AGAR|nr:hypothetical protein NLJ89_g10886 [Agrocybe chaxingu]